jgi:hypothetical protein
MSTATATVASVTYRKTRQGEWVAFGPVSAMPELRPGVSPEITVSKRDGTVKTERVTDYGKPFQADGVKCVYAYLAKSAPAPRAASRSRCGTCRCHSERNAGQPGSILFDGCERCGCESA